LFNGLTKPRAFFGGVARRNYPGSIRLINQDYQNLQELQVHAQELTRMEFNYEQEILFTGGAEGSLAMVTIVDRTTENRPQTKDPVQPSTLALLSKATFVKMESDIRRLREEIATKKDTQKRVMQQTKDENAIAISQ
jgi:hypothetical protein